MLVILSILLLDLVKSISAVYFIVTRKRLVLYIKHPGEKEDIWMQVFHQLYKQSASEAVGSKLVDINILKRTVHFQEVVKF